MAGARKPGPTGIHDHEERIDDGTLCRNTSLAPGYVDGAHRSGHSRFHLANQHTLPNLVLQPGDRNSNVRRLQTLLNSRMDLTFALKVDGYFGPRTRQVVERFQKSNSIIADGIVGKPTWFRLVAAPPKAMHVNDVAGWHLDKKCAEVAGLVAGKLPHHARAEINRLISKRTLTIALSDFATNSFQREQELASHGLLRALGEDVGVNIAHAIQVTVLAISEADLQEAAGHLSRAFLTDNIAALVGVLASHSGGKGGKTSKTDTTAAALADEPPAGRDGAPKRKRRFIEIHWEDVDTWCSETVTVAGTTENYSDGENVAITVTGTPAGSNLPNFNETISGDSFSHRWKVLEVLPPKSGGHYVKVVDADAHAEGKTTPTHLHIHFIPTVPKTHYSHDRAHFDLSATDYEIKIESEIKYIKGWGASVVKLGPAVPRATGGLLDGSLSWNGYRWMKQVAGTPKYWDGSAWKNLPAGFTLIDANNFCVGFYKTGNAFTCQYGGTWPEKFTDWDINAAPKQKKIKDWTDNIHSVWTGKFDIKRHECKSSTPKCCRYSTTASAKFTQKTSFASGMLIIADGNIRSNDSLWFLGEPRVTVAGHEFGHHLGNPDEYAGAVLDTSLNSDGATAGIDADSIMGQNLTKVKKRHYSTICKHFASMVQTLTGKSYTYEAVPVVAGGG